jgi:hypothetical protein
LRIDLYTPECICRWHRGQVGGVSRCRRAEGGLWRAGAELLMCLVSGQEHREGVRCAAIVLGARFS